jgi:hypothetical protein
MCVVAVRYIKGQGWIGGKNRDRNYETRVHITQSNRYGLQRLYIDDRLSRWTEGLNEHGLCIISASFSVKSDEKEGDEVQKKLGPARERPGYYSPDGRSIRQALRMDNPEAAVKFLSEQHLAGATYVFNAEDCYLLEGGFTVKKNDATKDNPRIYHFKIKKISNEHGYSVRTNHGIDIPELGYKVDASDEIFQKARQSSERRREIVLDGVSKSVNAKTFLAALSVTPEEDGFMNPIRMGDIKKKEMATTGQLLLVAKERALHYRPICCAVEFTYDKLNGPSAKTFFEIISSRKLLTFKEYFDAENLREAAEYQGKKVTLNKPFRTPDGPKKFSVYVNSDSGNVVKVNFGDPNMSIKRDDPARRRSFRARHNCADKTDKTKPSYWSCKFWSSKSVSDLLSGD